MLCLMNLEDIDQQLGTICSKIFLCPSNCRLWSFQIQLFLSPSYGCICFKCVAHTSKYVTYFHGLIKESDINNCVYGVAYPYTCSVAPAYKGISEALDIIHNVVHFYSTYVYVPGLHTFDEPPSTPTSSEVLLRTDDSVDTMTRDNQRKHIPSC